MAGKQTQTVLEKSVKWQKAFRVIPSCFPPINVFENVVSPDEFDIAMAIETLTNPRWRDEVGQIELIARDERVFGLGASIVMAAFTHFSPERASRFSDGSYGVYYAADSLETAVAETRFHRQQFCVATNEAPNDFHFRAYVNQIILPMHDIRNGFEHLHHAEDYAPSQTFARELKAQNSNGILYRSVRREGGECIAALRPKSVSLPVQTQHLIYHWNGQFITDVWRVDHVAI